MTGLIAVHCGAGTHNPRHYKKYNRLSKKACLKAVEILRNGGTALDAVKIAITVLEDDPLTNCGYGSNLTIDGLVETDASVMEGQTLSFGACGAVKNVKNPICLAHSICLKQSESLPLGLVPPSMLVGKGALFHAKNEGLKRVKQKDLISSKALAQYKKYKRLMDLQRNSERLDTVGAVCLDDRGQVAAGCSSGGILLKKSGRVGQAAVYASGVWADSFDKENENSVAVCTSGCGEHLIKTQLARSIGEDVKCSICPTVGLSESINKNFLNSRFLINAPSKLCGALVLHVDKKTGDISLLWGHTTESMSVGFMHCADKNAQALVSELPNDVPTGRKVNVSGCYKYSSVMLNIP